MKNEEVRVDKWLWAVRIFKTRSQASDACKNGKVQINGSIAKSSKTVRVGDVLEVKKMPIFYKYEVKELLQKRVGAKLVSKYCNDITPEQEIVKLDMARISVGGYRRKGDGRPTKKERRLLDNWQQNE
jgi:ribosome-associated heat shock protein Hsp15